MARQPTFAVHISLTASLKNVYSDLAERLLIAMSLEKPSERPNTCETPSGYHYMTGSATIKLDGPSRGT
jgi:hypothetical protein